MEVCRNLGNCLGQLTSGSSTADGKLTVDTIDVSRSIKKIAKVRANSEVTSARPWMYSGSSVFSSNEGVCCPLSSDRIVGAGVLMPDSEGSVRERE